MKERSQCVDHQKLEELAYLCDCEQTLQTVMIIFDSCGRLNIDLTKEQRNNAFLKMVEESMQNFKTDIATIINETSTAMQLAS